MYWISMSKENGVALRATSFSYLIKIHHIEFKNYSTIFWSHHSNVNKNKFMWQPTTKSTPLISLMTSKIRTYKIWVDPKSTTCWCFNAPKLYFQSTIGWFGIILDWIEHFRLRCRKNRIIQYNYKHTELSKTLAYIWSW